MSRGGVGGVDVCGLGIEGEDVDGAGGLAVVCGEFSRAGDEVLVGEVDAVEVADGDGGWLG